MEKRIVNLTPGNLSLISDIDSKLTLYGKSNLNTMVETLLESPLIEHITASESGKGNFEVTAQYNGVPLVINYMGNDLKKRPFIGPIKLPSLGDYFTLTMTTPNVNLKFELIPLFSKIFGLPIASYDKIGLSPKHCVTYLEWADAATAPIRIKSIMDKTKQRGYIKEYTSCFYDAKNIPGCGVVPIPEVAESSLSSSALPFNIFISRK